MKPFRHLFRLVIIIVFCYAIAGCFLRIQQPLNEQVLMPLRVGNWWKSQTITTMYSTEFSTLEDLHVVLADTMLEGRQWFLMSDSAMISYTPHGVRYRFQYNNHDTVGQPRYEEINIPHQIGDTVWIKVYHTSDSTYVRYLGIAQTLDTLICVPAGKFRCFMVATHIDDPYTVGLSMPWGGNTVAFYSPGFGKVKEEGGIGTYSGWSGFTWELIDYEIE